MKQKLILCAIFLVLILLIPCLALGGTVTSEHQPAKPSSTPSVISDIVSAVTNTPPQATPSAPSSDGQPLYAVLAEIPGYLSDTVVPKFLQAANPNVFHVLDESSGKVLSVSDKEFLYGAIVTEMPPTYEPEALKAQAVAAYTYYSTLREQQKKKPSPQLNGADFTVNTEQWHIYTTKEQMQKRWGKNFDFYYEKLTKVVNEVYGKTLQYDGQLITATYYAISSGQTEDAADIWGGSRDYLVPVASPGDVYADGYQTSVVLTEDELKTKALAKWPSCDFSASPDTWLAEISRTQSGSVSKMKIGGVECKGGDVRTALGLRSAHFTWDYRDGTFTFTVKGYGHGVGMSQVGAQYMAQHGSSYQQILSWYYPKSQLTS